MGKLSALILAGLFLTGCATTPKTGPAVTPSGDDNFLIDNAGGEIVHKPYEISGGTPEKLLKEMQSKGPLDDGAGQRFFARTKWYVKWRFDYDDSAEFCRAKDIRTDLKITYQMPTWPDKSEASPGLINYWNGFMANLAEHEIGHGDIGRKTETQINKTLSDYGGDHDSCRDLGKALNAIAHDIIDSSTLDADYDKETQHGKTQGAFFSVFDARRESFRRAAS